MTDFKGSKLGETQSFGQSYTNPVLLGQVMSDNDPDFSAFWSAGEKPWYPASSTALVTGKHVNGDTDTTRADELIGYVVFEAGAGLIGGVAFEASERRARKIPISCDWGYPRPRSGGQ